MREVLLVALTKIGPAAAGATLPLSSGPRMSPWKRVRHQAATTWQDPTSREGSSARLAEALATEDKTLVFWQPGPC